MKKTYCFCDRCGKPIEDQSTSIVPEFIICSDCALTIYRKIYKDDKEPDDQ